MGLRSFRTLKKFRKNGRIIKVLTRKLNDFVFGRKRTWPILYTDAFGIFVGDNGIKYNKKYFWFRYRAI